MTVELASVSSLSRIALFHHLDQYAALLSALTGQVHDLRLMEAEQMASSTVSYLDQGHTRVDSEKYAKLDCREFEYQRRRAEAQLSTTQVAYDHLRFVIEHRATTDVPEGA